MNTTELRYDARGQVTQTTDPEGYVTSHLYDGLNRRIQEFKPAGIKVDFDYDRDSQLTQ